MRCPRRHRRRRRRRRLFLVIAQAQRQRDKIMEARHIIRITSIAGRWHMRHRRELAASGALQLLDDGFGEYSIALNLRSLQYECSGI